MIAVLLQIYFAILANINLISVIVACVSLVIITNFINETVFILAGCMRVETVSGDVLSNYVDVVKGSTMFGNNFDLISLTSEKIFSNFRNFAATYRRNYVQYYLLSPVVNVITPEYAELVLNNHKLLLKSETYKLLEPFLGTGLLTSTDEKWHFRRKLLTPAFHFNILQRFLETFKEEVTKFNGNLQQSRKNHSQQIVNLSEIIPKFTLNNICETALGVNLDDVNKNTEYRNNIHNFEELYVKRVCNPIQYFDWIYRWNKDYKKMKGFVRELHQFSSEIIEKRRRLFKNPKNSNEESLYFKKERHAMLDTLLAAEKLNLIDHNGICEEVNTFMFEGFDTTSNGLIFTLLMLALHQDVQEKCLQEINEYPKDLSALNINDFNDFKYLDCVIKETFRLYPPVPLVARCCNAEMNVGDLILPKGTLFNIHIFDIHRDPKHFPNPEKFDPDRFLPENTIDRHPFAYIPFSAGPRNCIGQKFAMMEIKVLLVNFLKNYQLFPCTKMQDIVFEIGMVLRSKYPLEIKITPRVSHNN